MIWDQFNYLFRETYANLEHQIAKIKENKHLVEGVMTVAEYHAKFIKLPCYTTPVENDIVDR